MTRKILCLAIALAVLAAVPALAETAGPVTAEELDALLAAVRPEALAAAPLNDAAGAEAESEDGTLMQFESVKFYVDGTVLTAETPVNALVFDDMDKSVLRGVGIYSAPEDVLAAFPNENAEAAGTREGAVLYLQGTQEGGFVYGRILRNGQRVTAIEYGEVLPAGERFRCAAVTFSVFEGRVDAVRVDGLNPEIGLLDASYANELFTELEKLSGEEGYRAVKSSRNGLELTPFSEEDLAFSGISFPDLQPDGLPGETEKKIIDNEDGTWLMRCEGTGYEAVFTCGENGENAKILSFSILDDVMEGPRGVRPGDVFSEDFCRFRNGENEMTEDMTELLYGTEGVAPWGSASYDPSYGETVLQYVTSTQDGTQVELILRFVENYLKEIMLQTV